MVSGFTVKFPPLIVYVIPPEGMIAKDCPEQTLPLLTEIVGFGPIEITLTAVLDAAQPRLDVPVMLYEVVMVGETTNEPPVME